MKYIILLSLLSLFVNASLPAFVLIAKADEIPVMEFSEAENEVVSNVGAIPKKRTKRGAVAIFFGGILVGWVLDGTIKYATGKAPSEWVAWGLGRVHNYILTQARKGSGQVVVPNSGPFTCPGVVIDHSGMCH